VRASFLNTIPFDLYALSIFHLTVKHRSFTRAAQAAGLTQSAVSRQIQGMETAVGTLLLERTTRAVALTPAGEFLFQESKRLLGDVENSLKRLSEEFAGARKEIRVGVSRTIGLAYLPGFFHANIGRLPEVAYRVAYHPSAEILAAIEGNDLDIGVLCPTPRLPKTVSVTHQFQDAFTMIVSRPLAAQVEAHAKIKTKQDWLSRQNWLLLDERSNTGNQLRRWMKEEGWRIEPAMELDNFDLIINLVGLGMGVSFVPIRALALYNQRPLVKRVTLPRRFTRELVVVVRKRRHIPDHVSKFIENVLF
jgi:DNA-binding transcriptional LysR family regulator